MLLSWSRPTLVFKLESGMDAFIGYHYCVADNLVVLFFFGGVDILLRKETKHNSNINIILKLPIWAQPALVFNQDASKYLSFGKLRSVDFFPFQLDDFHLKSLSDPFEI